MATKVHWNDQHGPICDAYGGVNYIGYDWRNVTKRSLSEVTCKKCIKKLIQIGFNMAHFAETVNQAVGQRKA